MENERANIVNEACTVRIEELKAEAAESLEEDNEDEGEEGAPPMNYDTASLAQLGVDVEALELPPLPTEQELYVFEFLYFNTLLLTSMYEVIIVIY